MPGFCGCDCAPCPCTPDSGYYKLTFNVRSNSVTTGPFTFTYGPGTSTTLTLPTGVIDVEIICQGGGGGGGGGKSAPQQNPGGGGGGGGYAVTTSYVASGGDVLTITTGAHATGGASAGGGLVSAANGVDGGNALVQKGASTLCSADGGRGGRGGSYTGPGVGGAGGTSSGDIASNGTAGGNATTADFGMGGANGGGNGGDLSPSNGADATTDANVVVRYYVGSLCENCGFGSGLVMGLRPVVGECTWKNCVFVQDDSCKDVVHYPLTATLALSGSDMQLAFSGDKHQSATYTLAASSWNCSADNVMTLSSSTSDCTWASTVTVSATDASVCVVPVYYYYTAAPPPCGCGMKPLPRIVHATFSAEGSGDPSIDGQTFALTYQPSNEGLSIKGCVVPGDSTYASIAIWCSVPFDTGTDCGIASAIDWCQTTIGFTCGGEPGFNLITCRDNSASPACEPDVFWMLVSCDPLLIVFTNVFFDPGGPCDGIRPGCTFANPAGNYWTVAITD